MITKDFKLLLGKICFAAIIILFTITLIFLIIIFEFYPAELHAYVLDIKLLAKQICIPKELADLRASNNHSIHRLNKVSAELNSLQQQKIGLQKEVGTIKKLLVSEAYDVKLSKDQLLKKAITEEKLMNDKTEGQPGFTQLCLTGLVAYILLKSIILINIGWD